MKALNDYLFQLRICEAETQNDRFGFIEALFTAVSGQWLVVKAIGSTSEAEVNDFRSGHWFSGEGFNYGFQAELLHLKLTN